MEHGELLHSLARLQKGWQNSPLCDINRADAIGVLGRVVIVGWKAEASPAKTTIVSTRQTQEIVILAMVVCIW